ncbi:MAG: AEC family transporter [bacterium]|nr:AEC family transporter [bacterium]
MNSYSATTGNIEYNKPMLYSNIIFTVNIVSPVFIMILSGFMLKKAGLINDNFSSTGSKLVFNVCLPVLLFMKMLNVDIKNIINIKQILFCAAGTVLFFIFIWIIATALIKDSRDQGVFIQGSFRGNYAIIGIPLVVNTFGDAGLVNAVILLSLVIPLNNILAVLALTLPSGKEQRISMFRLAKNIIKNPLIIAIIISILSSYLQITVAPVILKTGNYLAQITIPLALISIGGTLHFDTICKGLKTTLSSALIKLIIMPLILTFLACLMGFRKTDLASIYFLFSAPTAIASFVMADAMGSNSQLAGTIVVVTTALSAITISAGIFILNYTGYL